MKKNLKVIVLAIVPVLVMFLSTIASSAQEAAKKDEHGTGRRNNYGP